MKNIILFTVSYPYGSKEQFLETEIRYLSQCFSKVIIIPTQTDGKMRDIPENVIVDRGFAEKSSTISFLINSFLTVHLYKELIEHPSVLLSLTKLSRLFAFTGKGVKLYKHLKKHYSPKNIFYSYWFNGSVFGCYLYNKHVHEIDFYTRVHGNDLYLEVNKGYLPLRPAVLSQINRIFSISSNGKRYLIDHYDVDESKVRISRLGTEDAQISTQMSEDPKLFSILSCSHLSPVKRIDMLAEALSLVAKENPDINIQWVHIGGGKQYQHVKDLTSQLSIGNLKVELLGNLSNEAVFEHYKTHEIDLFVNVSSSEGIPVTFMEAFSCSIPILAIDNGGVSEIVNSDNGVLLDHNSNSKEVASNISYYVKNKNELFAKKPMARRTWEKGYNADLNYISFCKELNEHD
ncbi:MAG: glycosyltransferase [Campylobacterota bacterium]